MKKERRRLLFQIIKSLSQAKRAMLGKQTVRIVSDRRPPVLGSIRALKQSVVKPVGAGWIKDPLSGLWTRGYCNHNIVTIPGLSAMAQWIQNGHANQGGSIKYLAVGTGYTTPTKTDVALEAQLEIGEIDEWDNDDIASDPVVMIATLMFLTTEANGDLTEAGLIEADSTDVMYCRGLFGYGEVEGATNWNPVRITSIAHGLADGDLIFFENVQGMTDLNGVPGGTEFYVNVLTTDTFELYLDADLTIPVDGTDSAWGVFDSGASDGGTWKTIIRKGDTEILTVNYSLTFPAD